MKKETYKKVMIIMSFTFMLGIVPLTKSHADELPQCVIKKQPKDDESWSVVTYELIIQKDEEGDSKLISNATTSSKTHLELGAQALEKAGHCNYKGENPPPKEKKAVCIVYRNAYGWRKAYLYFYDENLEYIRGKSQSFQRGGLFSSALNEATKEAKKYSQRGDCIY